MQRKALFTAAALIFAQTASAYDQKAVEATVTQINATAKVQSVKATPIAGLVEVIADGTVIYVSEDGKYILSGVLLDVANRKNLTEVAGATVRKTILSEIPQDQKIVYATAGKPKHRVTVFTDVSCHYCQELHKQMKAYQDLGIQVEYVAFPRGGTQSPVYGQMISVWCSKDKKTAIDAAYQGKPVASVPCDNPVATQYELGDKIGIEGTPAIYSESGLQVGGFLPPDQLLAALDALNKTPEADAK